MEQRGRPKGGKNRKWSKEEKLRVVRRYLDENIGRPTLAREEGISSGMLYHWIKRYMDEGEAGFEPKKRPGNIYSALYTSKSLSENERLRLTVAKQQIEIARLKNGYRVERSGANKEFVSLNVANTKSSKN